MRASTQQILVTLWVVAVAIPAFASAIAHAELRQLSPVGLNPETATFGFGEQIEFLIDDEGLLTLEGARNAYRQERFSKLGKTAANFGLANSTYWLKFDVVSNAPDTTRWVIALGKPYLRTAEIHLERNEETVAVLLDGSTTRFADRSNPNRMMVSTPFRLTPNKPATIWVRYAADASSNLPMRIQTQESFRGEVLSAEVLLTVYYAVGTMIAVFSVAIAFVFRSRVMTYYALFFILLLSFNAQINGSFFQHLWPNFPGFNALTAHPISLLSMAFAILFGREFVLGSDQPFKAMSRISAVLAGAAILCAAMPLVIDILTARKIGAIIALAIILVQLANAGVAFYHRRPGSVFFLAGAVLLLLYVGAFASVLVFFPGAHSVVYETMRYGQLLDGLVFAAAAFQMTYQLRKRADENASLATEKSRELAHARHDLQQPLLLLRTALRQIGEGGGSEAPEISARLAQSITYLEGLISGSSDADGKSSMESPLTVSDIVDGALLMFADDARTSGIALERQGESRLQIEDATALLRVLSNLLSNAIRHSGANAVTVSIENKNGVEVSVRDNGAGLPSADRERFVNSPGSEVVGKGKSGHGFDIIRRAALDQAWSVGVMSSPAEGTEFTIRLTAPAY